jgi:hypothetical protein
VAGLFLEATPDWGPGGWDYAEFAVPEGFAATLPPIDRVFLYHSRDDGEVPFRHLAWYAKRLPGGDSPGARWRRPLLSEWLARAGGGPTHRLIAPSRDGTQPGTRRASPRCPQAAASIVATPLHLTPKTVRNNLSNIFTKLQVADWAQAIIRNDATRGPATPSTSTHPRRKAHRGRKCAGPLSADSQRFHQRKVLLDPSPKRVNSRDKIPAHPGTFLWSKDTLTRFPLRYPPDTRGGDMSTIKTSDQNYNQNDGKPNKGPR